jgi:hypothetical protein
MIRYTHLLVDSAALELPGEVGREVNKHLAPPAARGSPRLALLLFANNCVD